MTAFRSTIQQQGRRTAERIVAPLARLGVTPNGLTAVGLLLNILAGLLLAWQVYIPGALMVLVAGAFDMLDGALARVSNRKTVFGGFFDSTIDRYSEAVVFLGLQVAFLRDATAGGPGGPAGAGGAGGDWYAWAGVVLCYVVAINSLLISYTRARAEVEGLNCEVGWLQRPERVIILGLGLLLPRPGPLIVLAGLAILTQITVLQRMLHVRRLTAERDKDG
ncbi:MAG TPA: CDP-alcohol phosphatidyltransferase family protein [Chloroflexota bacterium]|nr:CDP-alcohol phosphatidyltransferase family protein [Chloroflexota bacterium]